ncbi:pentapeptide repeat-containing protein [Cupriavidus gilardii]|uniref:pentapeptide repeat-containing protein n=1 Tax=Cupriavidus gilardii TaxID=82541 RepID=UPI0021B413A6|nr:pentapeptide repeat-containing protein [Cupriavidus gilardii]UXC38050.1 pentapeptide repeat-containing protein [Cupriavidus gilardii]
MTMRTYHTLAYADCTAFSAALESPDGGRAISAALVRGELIEVQGHRFRLCRSSSGWKIKTASLWQMTHRQRFARLMRCLRLGGDEVLWESRVRRFVKHWALRVETDGGNEGGKGGSADGSRDCARPRVVPLYIKGWLPPALDHHGLPAESREAGRRRRAQLLRYVQRPQSEPDGASERTGEASHSRPTMPPDTELRRLCPEVAQRLFGPGSDLRGRNLRDSRLGPLDLGGADLRGAVLVRCDAVEADLRNADLRDADLRLADLRRARLDGARLSGAQLAGTRLQNASLGGADLRGQTLNAMALAGATLSGADLTGAGFVLPPDALVDGATRRAALKPLHQHDGNLLWTVVSLSDRQRRRELMAAIVNALNCAAAQNEDISDTNDALAELLLKDIDQYWESAGEKSTDIVLDHCIRRLARHQCQRLAKTLPESCEEVLLKLADRYRAMFAKYDPAMFAKFGELPWELTLEPRSSPIKVVPDQSSVTPVSAVSFSTTGR